MFPFSSVWLWDKYPTLLFLHCGGVTGMLWLEFGWLDYSVAQEHLCISRPGGICTQ